MLRALNDDSGASLVEYALLLLLIVIVALGAVELVGQENASMWTEIEAGIPG